MFLSCRRLHQFSVHTVDCKKGDLEEVYVDTSKWVVRYLYAVLKDQESVEYALVSPISVTAKNPNEKVVYVNLSYKQLWESPAIGVDEPLTREFETVINDYYGLSAYWPGSGDWGTTDSPQSLQNPKLRELVITPESKCETETHLVRFTELSGRVLTNSEKKLGRIVDLMINENSWKIGYLVVDEHDRPSRNRYMLEPADLFKSDGHEIR